MTDREGSMAGGHEGGGVPAGDETGRGRGGGAAALIAAAVAIVLAALVVWWILADDQSVLVVVDPQQARVLNLQEGQEVRVVGTVRLFELDDFEGVGDGDDFGEFEGTPVIVAQSVRPVGEDGGDEGDVLDRIADEDTDIVGRQVTVTGEVDERVGVASFLLQGD